MQIWNVLVLMRPSLVRVLVGMPRLRRHPRMAMLVVVVVVTVPMRVHHRRVRVRVPVLLGAHDPQRQDHQRGGEDLLRQSRLAEYHPG